MAAPEYLLTGQGRCFVSLRDLGPAFHYLGAARLNSVQAARGSTTLRGGRANLNPLAATASLTMRMLHTDVAGAFLEGAPTDLLVCYGAAANVVATDTWEQAVVLEDCVFTDHSLGNATAMQSGDQAVVELAANLAVGAVYTLQPGASLPVLASLSHGLVVAVSTDESGRPLALTAATSGALHDLVLWRLDNDLWSRYPLGTFSSLAASGYKLAAAGGRIYFIAGGGIWMAMAPPRGWGYAVAPTQIAPPDGSSDQPVAVCRRRADEALAVTANGKLWRLTATGAQYVRALPGVSSVTYLGVYGDDVVVASQSKLFVLGAGGRERSVSLPASKQLRAARALGRYLQAVTTDGYVYASYGDGSWTKTWQLPAAADIALFASRAVAYAVVTVAAKSELWLSVDGARVWRRVGQTATGGPIQTLHALPTGELIAGGRVDAGGITAATTVGRLFGLQPNSRLKGS